MVICTCYKCAQYMHTKISLITENISLGHEESPWWEEPCKIIHSELGRRRDHIDQTCLQRKQTDRGRGGKQGQETEKGASLVRCTVNRNENSRSPNTLMTLFSPHHTAF